MGKKLNLKQKQELFCLEYIQTGQATKSAILAKYAPGSAHVTAYRLLKNDKILRRIDELRKESEAKTILNVTQRQELLAKLASTGTVNPKSITPRDRISAVQELNRMDHIYEISPTINRELHQTVVFVLPDGTKLPPNLLLGQAQDTPSQPVDIT